VIRQAEPIAIIDLLSLTLSNLKSGVNATSLPTVFVNAPDRLPMVLGDGEAIMQLFMKLLDNALRFTPKTGTVSITIQAIDKQLQIQISDTGCGIEPSRLDTIFDRFYQEEGFLQRSVGGTGLGLAICRQLVRRLEGRLWATSDGKGKGSQFFVTLPVDEMANLEDMEMLIG
jgi:signal transduction histidine kinase